MTALALHRRLWSGVRRFVRWALSRVVAGFRHLTKLISSITSALAVVATILSAFAALTALRVQEDSAINAVRPELIVEWKPDIVSDYIASEADRFRAYQLLAVENIGEGPAFSIRGELRTPGRDAPFCAWLLYDPVHVLPKGKRKDIDPF